MIKGIILGALAPFVAVALFAASPVMAETVTPSTPSYEQLRQDAINQANAEVAAKLAGPTTTETSSSTQTAPPPTGDVIVLNTGDGTTIDTSNDTTNTTTVENNNAAVVNQTVNCDANSGDNTADRNISFGGDAGSIQTGDAACNTGLSTDVNHNTTQINGSCPDLTNNVTVYNTGDDVNQTSSTSNTCVTSVTNNNTATINQVVNGNANTGGNEASRNIAIGGGTAGQILTGNASVGSILVARGNQNLVIVGGQSNNGAPGTGANIYILNTGDGAVLVDRRRYATSTSVVNNNDLLSNQLVHANADTGNNDASRNINQSGDAGVIATGDAIVNTALSVSANRNETMITGSGGNATTNLQMVNTGDNLNNDTSTSVDNTTTVTNNNTAVINQQVEASANTGNNTANRNIAFGGDAGRISTGDAVVNTALSTNANQNNTAISGATGQAVSNVNVTNTGDDINVDTHTDTSNTVNVTNNNTALVNQQVTVHADTGSNEANQNIGGSSITTGNVTINTLAIANVNGNLTLIVNADAGIGSAFWNLFTQMFGHDLYGATVTIQGSMTQPQAAASVTNTGDNVVVDLSQAQINAISVTNNNNAIINQNVVTNANTGHNQCAQNVGDCQIVTGDINVSNVLLANANGNVTLIGNVTFPEDPNTPVTPEVVTPEPEAPVATQPTSAVLGVSTTAAPVGGETLPTTGANDFAMIGFLLIGAGYALRRKTATT